MSRVQGFFHHATQELMMRAVVQGSLHRLYGDAGWWSAIISTSAIFATGHIHISFGFALITFVGGLFFGWVYARHGTIIGVSVLHFILHTTRKWPGLSSVLRSGVPPTPRWSAYS